MSLQDRLNPFKADFESGKPPRKAPPEVIATMHRSTAELIGSGQASRAKRAGEKAPDFELNDPDGNPVRFRHLTERRAQRSRRRFQDPFRAARLPDRVVPGH